MTNFLDDTTKYVNKALKFSDLPDDLSKKIIICNNNKCNARYSFVKY